MLYKYTILLGFALILLLSPPALHAKNLKMVPKSEKGAKVVSLPIVPAEPPYEKISEITLLTSEIQLVKPADIAIGNDGSVYVTDIGNRAVIKLSPEGKMVWMLQATQDRRMAFPVKIAYDGLNTLYVGELYEGVIYAVSTDGKYVRQFGERGDEPGKFTQLGGLCVSPLGNIFVAALARDKIIQYKSDGTYVKEFGESGDGDGRIFAPTGLKCDDEGNLWVIDLNDRIQLFSSDGIFKKKWGGMGAEAGQLRDPRGLALDSNGLVYVADTGNHRIQRLSLTHEDVSTVVRPNMVWGDTPSKTPDLREPTGIEVMNDGTVVVADPKAGKVTFWRQAPSTPKAK